MLRLALGKIEIKQLEYNILNFFRFTSNKILIREIKISTKGIYFNNTRNLLQNTKSTTFLDMIINRINKSNFSYDY